MGVVVMYQVLLLRCGGKGLETVTIIKSAES